MAQPRKFTDQDNLMARMMLLNRGVRMRTFLGRFGPYAAGSTNSIKLRNLGISTHLDVRVEATQAASTTLTASALAPYNAIAKFSFLDYSSTERLAVPGWQLYLINSTRQGRPFMCTGQGSVDTQQSAAPVTTGGGTLYANYRIPFAIDPATDLTGAILSQTVVGEQFLVVTTNTTALGTDPIANVYTAGTGGTLTNFYINVWQNWIQPPDAATPLPLFDLNTVYEINGVMQSSSDISTGGTKYIDYPNVRSVRGLYLAFLNNGTLTVNGTDISRMDLVANGNTNMMERDPLNVRRYMRNAIGGDLPAGCYVTDTARNPIATFIYSQVQHKTIFNTVTTGATTYMAWGFESTYPQNQPLPGVGLS